MITASEPMEFLPRGREVMKSHPGPIDYEEEPPADGYPAELLLLRRLANVKISLDEKRPIEHYRLREVKIDMRDSDGVETNDEHGYERADGAISPPMPYINKEEELYVSDNTAVWTRGIGGADEEALPQISYTCDTPVRFAFFCPQRFVRPDTAPAGKRDAGSRAAVCLIDADTIHVFCDDGETYKAMLQCPIASVWMMPDGIMLERCFSDQSPAPMCPGGPTWPRLFTLTFTLEEMKPALLAMDGDVRVVTEANTRMVFSSDQVQLVLLYSEKLGKHIICRLRHSTEADLEVVRDAYASVCDDVDDSEDEQNETLPPPAGQSHTTTANASNAADLKHMRTFEIGATSATTTAMGTVAGGAHTSVGPGTTVKTCYDTILKGVKATKETPKRTAICEMKDLHDGPSFCLQHIWTDKGGSATGPGGVSIPLWSAANGEMASTAFLHTDLVGNRYLCYLQSRACRLTLVHYREPDLSIVSCRTVPARSAIALDRLNMLVLLDLGGRLVLYSGPTAVGKLHVAGLQSASAFRAPQSAASGSGGVVVADPPLGRVHPKRSTLLPNVTPSEGKFEEELHLLSPIRPSPVAGGSGATTPTLDPSPIRELLDATGTRFTLALGNGRLVRVLMAPVAQSRLIVGCLRALRTVLPRTVANEFFVRWYGTRNVPGSQAGFTVQREWEMFRELLLTVMGRPAGEGGTVQPRVPGVRRTHDGDGSDEEPKKRRRAEGQPNDWQYLAELDGADRPPAVALEPLDADGQPGAGDIRTYQQREPYSLYPHIAAIVEALHLLYEDLKLDLCRKQDLGRLADLLYRLAKDGGLRAYQAHYFLDFPVLLDVHRHDEICPIPEGLDALAAAGQPLSILRYVERTLQDAEETLAPFPYRAGINERSCDTVALLAYIYRARCQRHWALVRPGSVVRDIEPPAHALLLPAGEREHDGADAFRVAGESVLTYLADRGYTRGWIDCLPVGMRYVVLRCLEQCRKYLVHGQRAAFYKLLMRPELRQHELRTDADMEVTQKVIPPPDPEKNVRRPVPQPPQTVMDAALEARAKQLPKLEPVLGGLDDFDELVADCGDVEITGTAAGMGAIFTTGQTNAATGGAVGPGPKEDPARAGVGTCRGDTDGMGGLDEEVLQILFPDDKRMVDVRRFLDSSQRVRVTLLPAATVPEHQLQEAQERRLYAIALRTMALGIGRGMYTVASCRPAETQTVPIPRLCLTGRDATGVTIDIQQIEVPPNMALWPTFHNGVAAGLRICPGTPQLTSSWITHNRPAGARGTGGGSGGGGGGGPPPPPAPGTDSATEHGGFLLALGLTGHLSQLSHYSTYDYMVNSDDMVRLGLLLGLAAAYRGTANPTITRLLAVHVEALLPPTAVELDVTQNLQVAAALGVGLLYQGTAKRHIAEVLLYEIGRPPGPEMENSVERESYALTAGLALGLVMLGRGDDTSALEDLTIPEQLYHYMNGGYRRPMMGPQKEKYRLPSFQIKEGPVVNLDVTAPGAILALGLMYFATGNETVANWLEPPSSNYMLGFVRPDLQLLRTIARHLVHWDRIRPDRAWIEQHVPAELRQVVLQPPATTGTTDDEPDADDATMNRVVGARPMSRRAERQLYCQAYYATVSGSALAIGLRYAGTGDERAATTIETLLHYFIQQGVALRRTPPPAPTSLPRLAGHQSIENCTLMLVLAMSLVLAGTGSLRVLRVVRMLRARTRTPHVTYGSHMAVHMALGFLYLGGGRYTLARSPPAIAALLCAIFPKFPTSSNDNRYHLQAFRHLYVLAIEQRIFLPRNIDTGRLCVCLIRYALRGADGPPVERQAPCLLPELDTLEWLEVCDDNFWNFRFDRDRNWHLLEKMMRQNGRVGVKQHIGSLSLQDDPSRLLANKLCPLTANKHRQWHFVPEDLLRLKRQLEVLNLCLKLLIPPDRRSLISPLDVHRDSAYERFSRALRWRHVTDGVMQDRLHAIAIYNGVSQMLHDSILEMSTTGSLDIWQLRILSAALTRFERTHQQPGARDLLYPDLLRALIERIFRQGDDARTRFYPLVRQYLLAVYGDEPFEKHLQRSLLPASDGARPGDDRDPDERRLFQLTHLTKLIALYSLPCSRVGLPCDQQESCVGQLVEMLRTDEQGDKVFCLLDAVFRDW